MQKPMAKVASSWPFASKGRHESTNARSDRLVNNVSFFRAVVAVVSGGKNRHNATATTRLIAPSAMNDASQLASAATSPATARPVNPPAIVPVMYAAIPRPPCEAGHTSWMYATVPANTPGVTNPRMKRQKMSWDNDVEVAASAVAIAIANADPTMTRRRPKVSASRPIPGAASATAMVGAVTVRLTANRDAWKVRASSGSSG